MPHVLLAVNLSNANGHFQDGRPTITPWQAPAWLFPYRPPPTDLKAVSDPRSNPPNLLGVEPSRLRKSLAAHFLARGQPGYRSAQVMEWLFHGDATSVTDMTNLPVGEREALARSFRLEEPAIDLVSQSADGTVKHLWRVGGGEVVESVLIPSGKRLTLCISSQAGCALACKFCATGWSGFGRQLTTAEIVGQFRSSVRWARENGRGAVTNVVFMGMGEPLANRPNLFPALSLLNQGYGVGARRITVSTVGVVPGILELAERPEPFRLALSLHAPESRLRAELIPLERRYSLDAVMDALDIFNQSPGRRITFEYTMIRNVNDAPTLLPALIDLALRTRAFVNLIPFNPIPNVDWQPSRRAQVERFRTSLEEANVPVAVRAPRGRDIDAACGQLRASQHPRSVSPIRVS